MKSNAPSVPLGAAASLPGSLKRSVEHLVTRLCQGLAPSAVWCLTLLALLTPANAAPQAAVAPANCSTPGCKVTSVNISTGYDHNNSNPYPVPTGSVSTVADAWWTLVGAPNVGLLVPSPAFVIKPNIAWANQTGSRWISAYNTDALILNNPSPNAAYAFERCICVCEPTNLRIQFDLLVDNIAAVYFDGVLKASQNNGGTSSFQTPLSVDFTVAVDSGTHCLRVDLRNLSGVAMGFNIEGSIETSPPGGPIMLSPPCCEPFGQVIACCFADTNCDGVKDSPLKPLVGWPITMQPGNHTALTDGQGYAYFTVPAGSYSIQESVQSGWAPGTPATGAFAVGVTTGTVQTLEFLNCPKNASITICKYLDSDCDGSKDVPAVGLAGWDFRLWRQSAGQFPGPGGFSAGLIDISKAFQFAHGQPVMTRSSFAFFTGTTGSDGCVTIAVPPGTYKVEEVTKPGWTVTNPSAGFAIVTVSPGSSAGLEFVNCPADTVWTDLGCATSGPFGTPLLTATGNLVPGQTITLSISSAPPGKFVNVFLGLSTVALPIFCGTLKVSAPQLPTLLAGQTDANGAFSVQFTWPSGIPPGQPFYAQAVIEDASHPCGGVLSNAVCAKAP